MRKWIARGVVGMTVLVSGTGAAFMVLADMGERKLTRRIDVEVTPVAFRSDAGFVQLKPARREKHAYSEGKRCRDVL